MEIRGVLLLLIRALFLFAVFLQQVAAGIFDKSFINQKIQDAPPVGRHAVDDHHYLLGAGKGDITGPVVDITFMGFAMGEQKGTGLRQRLYSRAFIVGDVNKPKDRIVYLVLDIQSGDTAVRNGILAGLKKMGPEYAVYTTDNIALTGTHSHSGPGGWSNLFLHHVSVQGFDKATWQAVVNGSLLSIKRAHESLREGRLSFGKTRIEDANINRSLFAYMANPESERKKYSDTVDKDLSLLRFADLNGTTRGVLTFFATHGTSLLANNTLVTGDNKGVAAYLFEKKMQSTSPEFIAGFSQSNCGDVSPNINGAYCEGGVDNGKPCKLDDSTCSGRVGPCHARGPFFGLNDGGTKSGYEIGRRQFVKAHELLQTMSSGDVGSNEILIRGPVKSFHFWKDMSYFKFPHPSGATVQTCPPALGYSFAAGTSDGPGIADFKQGLNTSKPDVSLIWPVLSWIIRTPTQKQLNCQEPKPILLDIGEMLAPYDWSPRYIDVQLMRIGQLIMIISPVEATTMAGRRWRDAIANAVTKTNLLSDTPTVNSQEPIVVLGGPANTYGHYATTEEEYEIQRYEGASTLFGPNTLNAFIHLTSTNVKHLSTSNIQSIWAGVPEADNTDKAWSLIPGVPIDLTTINRPFGSIAREPTSLYRRGQMASASFVAGCPRNNFRLEGSYALLQKYREHTTSRNTTFYESKRDLPDSSHQMKLADEAELLSPLADEMQPFTGSASDKAGWIDATHPDAILRNVDVSEAAEWETVRDDSDWDLVFRWQRVGFLSTSFFGGPSSATIEWEIGHDAEPGKYRFVYNGDAKDPSGSVTAFQGISSAFSVV